MKQEEPKKKKPRREVQHSEIIKTIKIMVGLVIMLAEAAAKTAMEMTLMVATAIKATATWSIQHNLKSSNARPKVNVK